jgi:transposase
MLGTSEVAGQRAAIVMNLVPVGQTQRTRSVGLLRDVPERVPSHPNSRIDELLPHRWKKSDT